MKGSSPSDAKGNSHQAISHISCKSGWFIVVLIRACRFFVPGPHKTSIITLP